MNSLKLLIAMGMLFLGFSAPALPPIIKWAGGKERELPHILKNAPPRYERYFEPFVGGGSVFAAVTAKEYIINDKARELVDLYLAIRIQDMNVFSKLSAINDSWKGMFAFATKHMQELKAIYKALEDYNWQSIKTEKQITAFLKSNDDELLDLLGEMRMDNSAFRKELKRNVVQKLHRMKRIEQNKHRMDEDDLEDNLRTAFMGSLYMYYRSLYNKQAYNNDKELATALFVFIRNYAYSGMFRYNANGEFNVPYGGIGYNSKTLDKKLAYYQSPELAKRLQNTMIECLDFLEFLQKHPPHENDFMFLDPPYDSDFSTYAQNAFDKADQERLAKYLTEECKCKWLMIIKNTPFIYSLYDGKGLTIKAFNKKYQVSFMNRNDRETEHLIIMNYNQK